MGLINQYGLFSGAGLVDQAGLYNESGLYVPGSFSPLSLNPLLAYDAESSMLATGGGAASQGDGIATLDDLSDNDIDATQTTANHQPIAYDADNGGPFARFDGSDDRMSFTLASPITNGTVFFATKKGSYAANLNLAAGTHNFSGNKISNNYLFSNDLIALYLFDYELSETQIAERKSYFVTKGAVEDYGAQNIFAYAWRRCTSLTSFPLINTSSGNDFKFAWLDCTSLTSFPLIDISLGRNFLLTWRNCSSLEDFPEGFFNNWNPSSITNGVFNETWERCSSLTSESVENILVSIDNSGQHATTTGASGGTALGDPEIDIDYDIATGLLTSATTTAIANLQGKGWGIRINGTLIP